MLIRKPIDFEAIASLDKPLDDQLDQFLYEKEGMLGECIVHSIHIVGESRLPAKAVLRLKISEALEVFEKRTRQVSLSSQSIPDMKDFQMTISLINSCLWHYVETLQSCSIELFRQLEQVGLEKWHKEMPTIVNNIKVILIHRIEDVAWAIRRMESLLWQYRKVCIGDKSGWSNFQKWLPWTRLIDRNLLIQLEKSKKFLNENFKKFSSRMKNYNEYYEAIDEKIQTFKNYYVYNYLDSNDKANFKRIYELLYLWEFNKNSHSLPTRDIIRSLRHVQSEEKVYQLFEEYYQDLQEILFNQSRLLKLGSKDLWEDATGKKLALEVIDGHRIEVNNLGGTVKKYRDFLLHTDSNPFIRSRFDFAEWLVGPKPIQSKRLLQLMEKIDSLEGHYLHLRTSLEKGPSGIEASEIAYASQMIDYSLHEASQPLSSKAIVHTQVERITKLLAELDELGSFNRNMIDFVGEVLSKTLRADWKYNVTCDIPKFQEIFQIHMGMLGPSEDRQHLNRKNKFAHIFQQIQNWTQRKVTQRHVQEIEQDISDIKIYLQDFLGYVQRIVSIPKSDENDVFNETRKEINRQLLEYRYQFANFFHQLSLRDPEERALRNQFLFVYQYFEAIENKIIEK